MVFNRDFVGREKSSEAREASDFGGFESFFGVGAGATRGEEFPVLGGGVVVAKRGAGETEARAAMGFVIKMRKFEEGASRYVGSVKR